MAVDRQRLGASLVGFVLMFFILVHAEVQTQEEEATMEQISVTSSAFKQNGMIPQKYTCDGEDISPELEWSGVPGHAASLALISDDPDAPMKTWVHWVLYNLPASLTQLPEDVPPIESLDNGGAHGTNDFRRLGYGGPCPPGGTHRYSFKIYALDQKLELRPGATRDQLEEAMQGHILAQGELVGKYARK